MGTRRNWGLGRYTADERDLVITPTNYSSGAPLVVVAHGFGGNATFYDPPHRRRDLEILAEAGCVVIVTDLGGASTWGNDTFLARVDEVRSYAETDWHVDPDRLGLIGDSMGAMGVLNYHWRHPDDVNGTVCRLPIVAADALRTRDPEGLGSAIDTAYSDDWAAARPDHDPLANAAAIEAFRRNVRLYYSTNDPIIPTSDIDSFLEAAGMTRIYARSLGPVGHDPDLTYERIPARRQAIWLLSRLRT